jgi:hypothetical protein
MELWSGDFALHIRMRKGGEFQWGAISSLCGCSIPERPLVYALSSRFFDRILEFWMTSEKLNLSFVFQKLFGNPNGIQFE